MLHNGSGERLALALFLCVTLIVLLIIWKGNNPLLVSHSGLPNEKVTDVRVWNTPAGSTERVINTPRVDQPTSGISED